MGDTLALCFVFSWWWHTKDLNICCATIIFAVLLHEKSLSLSGNGAEGSPGFAPICLQGDSAVPIWHNPAKSTQRKVREFLPLFWGGSLHTTSHNLPLCCSLIIIFSRYLIISFSRGWRVCRFSLWFGWTSRPTQKKGNQWFKRDILKVF